MNEQFREPGCLASRLQRGCERVGADAGKDGRSVKAHASRSIARSLRRAADILSLLADACSRAAERLSPSVAESHDLAPALRVERFSELEREAFRQQTRTVGHLRVIPGSLLTAALYRSAKVIHRGGQ